MFDLNPGIWKIWERSGKGEFLKTCKELVQGLDKSIIQGCGEKYRDLTRFIYDLIWHGIKGQIRREATISMLGELVALHSDIPSIVLDVISIIDTETACAETNADDRQRFCIIVKESEKHLSEKLMKERLDIDTLQDIGTLKNKNFYTKFIKVKTKLYYKQRKFNLFREESEGYAKLTTELGSNHGTDSVSMKNKLEVIKSLIGCFNLDPNRVLDIILESFECHPESELFFISLLKSYMCDAKILSEVLGFKLCFYHQNAEEPTPESLYLVTALMLQHGIVLLDDIFEWLTPDDKTIVKEFNKEMSEAKEYVRKMNIVSTKDKEENLEEKENLKEKYALNQKFGLCEALLKVGDWANAEQLVRKLPERYVLDQPPIARALCQLLHSVIEPLYRRNSTVPLSQIGRPSPPLKSVLAPKCVTNFTEFKTVVIPMLLSLGSSLHCDPILMHKLIRLLHVSLTLNEDTGSPITKPESSIMYYECVTLLDQVILPSLSFMDCNCCIAEEIWSILKLYPYSLRYCLYSRWKNETYVGNAKLMHKRADALKKIKAIMKRVSKENLKPVGRSLGKLSHSAPTYLFEYVLVQISLYDNLISPVVDSLKYLTSLSYDVISFCLIESLANVDRDKVKQDDGTSISLWLQSLASFSGAIYKKYNLELTGLLQYVANQLKAQESLDLLILKEIVQKMAGIEAAEEMTTEQLDAMAGGELLKGEAGYFSQVRNTKKASQRLKEALSENDLAVSLCLLMAQQRNCVVFKEMETTHLKLVGKLFDQCQDTLVQFGTFLSSTMSVEEYVSKFPSIQRLLSEFHVNADVAFFLARPSFNHTINMKYDTLRKSDPNWKKVSAGDRHKKYCDIVKEVMDPIVASVRPTQSLKIWEDISPQFFVTFWSLNMYDLYVPTESYQREINKLKQQNLQLMDSKELTAGKTKKEQERYLLLIDKLQEEKKKQEEHVERVQARLIQEKDSWFLSRSAKSAKNETITQFLQLCLFPRCTFTAVDSLYCAKFVHTIHSLKTANFSTLLCYDRLFCDITYSVTSCTENEANRYGRFLCAMLETVMTWHSDKNVFEKECANYPGFVTKFRVSNHFSEANDHVGFENYRHVCHKWHYKITKAMVVCLDSKDYVQIRNALIILIKILPHFPILAKLSQIIERKIEKVKDEEKNNRQDLFILATSYIGQLKTRSATMIRETDFHLIGDKGSKSSDTVNQKQSDQTISKQANGEIKSDRASTEKQSTKEPSAKEPGGIIKESLAAKEAVVREARDRIDKRSVSRQDEVSSSSKATSSHGSSKEKPEKEKSKDKDYEPKEKVSKKEERREESADKEKRSKDKKEEKASQREERQIQKDEKQALREERQALREERLAHREERQREERQVRETAQERSVQRDDRYRDERYIDVSSSGMKDDARYSNSMERYYGSSQERSHYYSHEDRDLSSLSNSSSGSVHRHSQEPPEVDREVKRRKMESGSSKSSKHEERKQQQLLEALAAGGSLEKTEKKGRRSKSKDKVSRDRGATEEEKELRKERKLGRKRDRLEEGAPLLAEQKRRKDEEKLIKMSSHQNGDSGESHSTLNREKHHYREKSPYSRERSHDREGRDKHRRAGESKRR